LKLPPFLYRSPATVEEALALLGEHGDDGKVLAGGQSLVPLLALRLARPEVLIDVGRIAGLSTLARAPSDESANGSVRVGALVRERDAERSDAIRDGVPLLADALPLIGHAAIRNRGTIGGSVAHADPAAELPAVMLATDAHLVARSAARGERSIAAGDFFLGHFTTALEADELLTEVVIPLTPRAGTAFLEAARRHGDFAIVGAAASIVLEEGGDNVADARVALIGVASTALRRREAERVLVGSPPSDEAFRAAAEEATRELAPPSDLHGSSAYRRKVAAVLVRRALHQAAEKAVRP